MSATHVRVFLSILYLAPLWLLVPFLGAALYSAPETDDFCLAAHDLAGSLSQVWLYYTTVTGRLAAVSLMTVPPMAAKAAGLDWVALYPLANLAMILLLIGAVIVVMRIVLQSWLLGGLAGLCVVAAFSSTLTNVHEFFYWFTGAACYLVPMVGCVLTVGLLSGAAMSGGWMQRRSLVVLAVVCLISAMCNEFTAMLLGGVVALSWVHRFLFRYPPQSAAHAVLMASVIFGFVVVVVAPGNFVRLASIPGSRDVGFAWTSALTHLPEFLKRLVLMPEMRWFGLGVACFAIAAGPLDPKRRVGPNLVYAILLFAGVMAWTFATYFIGAFSTAQVLAQRARDEVWSVVQVAGVVAVVIVVRSLIPQQMVSINQRGAFALVGVLAAMPLRNGFAAEGLRAQWPQLATFWRESVARHNLLLTTSLSDVVVPRRSVMPVVLVEEELKLTPGGLPNDCVAAWYGKRSVVLAPPD